MGDWKSLQKYKETYGKTVLTNNYIIKAHITIIYHTHISLDKRKYKRKEIEQIINLGHFFLGLEIKGTKII